MYVYIHVYIYIYKYTYIHIYISRVVETIEPERRLLKNELHYVPATSHKSKETSVHMVEILSTPLA